MPVSRQQVTAHHAAVLGGHDHTPRAQRRPRETRLSWAEPADQDISALVASLSGHNVTATKRCLAAVCNLTLWKSSNQVAVVHQQGIEFLLQIVTAATAPPAMSEQSAEIAELALWVLTNLAGNGSLVSKFVSTPGCLTTLVQLLSNKSGNVAVFALRCLINLTHPSAEAQVAVEQAGVLEPLLAILTMPITSSMDCGAVKAATWLLANLTASFDTSVKDVIISRPAIAAKLVSLLACNTASIVVLAANVVGNVARAGAAHQSCLAASGAVRQLVQLLQQQSNSKVVAAASSALAALVLHHTPNTALVQCTPEFATSLGLQLKLRTSLFDTNSDDAMAVVAAHTLIHVLGYMAVQHSTFQANGAGLQGSAAQAHSQSAAAAAQAAGNTDAAGCQEAASGDVDAIARVLLPCAALGTLQASATATMTTAGGEKVKSIMQLGDILQPQGPSTPIPASMLAAPYSPTDADDDKDAGSAGRYLTLEQAAQAVGMPLPAEAPAAHQAGPPAAADISIVELAELKYLVHDKLLAQLREPNVRTATLAAAQLYLMAASSGPQARACHCMMADAGLVQQLVALLASFDPQLVQVCLCVLDVLSSIPTCALLLMEAGWLDHLVLLLESPDPLVCRWAERALHSLHGSVQA